jgi:two-component system, response regulator
MENKMILLVEDDADDEFFILRALKKHGIANRVSVVRDGAEALDFLFCTNAYAERDPSDLPELILLDIKLPKISGLEVLQHIRAKGGTSLVPVVMLTSSKEPEDRVKAYRAGANSYIQKPIDFSDLIKSVRLLSMYWLMLNLGPVN